MKRMLTRSGGTWKLGGVAALALAAGCGTPEPEVSWHKDVSPIMQEHCTRCHVVGDINPYGGIESTPSFIGMKYLADWERRFEEFYILPPHPALVRIADVSADRDDSRPAFVQEIVLTIEDVDAILAFVRTLPSPAR